ncbi:hypothetical protein F53441_13817 [Fusarium austroafricanum]|uniref:Heterokaryon incompatibility domain-containing protein n=1 Tax=Fusarium austroafricanum TaxID=2364996 RepID=A0A8H4JMK9_9HYPO|nr:hypothetical protein F53441_13817 [Fusarium austroafricanum]
MPTKLCAPCRKTFFTSEITIDVSSAYIAFHEAPWEAFQKHPDASQDALKTVAGCDFCSFVVAYAASNRALGEYGQAHLSFFYPGKRWRRGKPMIELWQYYMYTFEGHLSAGFKLRRHKTRGRNEVDMRLFEASARLVKIVSDTDGLPETIRVIETNEVNRVSCNIEYATLSYCWGKKPFARLLRSNIDLMKSGFPVQDLPATFRDAMTTTLRLGLKYIWIDALCIIQQDAQDWNLHSVTMSKVYSYSTITLAAAASPDSHGGLFRHRNPTAINGVRLDLKWTASEFKEGEYYLVPTDPWVNAVAKSPLLKRAWVFQERLLSRGTVYFAHDMLYWECGELYASELYPEGGPWDLRYRYRNYDVSDRLPPGVLPVDDYRFKHAYTDILTRELADNTTMDEEMFLYVWLSVVAQYSAGKLTEERDKLIAIDGVAEQMTSIVSREHYINGLWRQRTLPLFLLWFSAGQATPLGTRVAPSWSWASVDTPVQFNFLFRAQTEPKVVAKVTDIITPQAYKPERLGISPSTALILQGPLTEVCFRFAARSWLGPLHSSWWEPYCTFKDRIMFIWPLTFRGVLAFKDKGLKAEYPCDISLDRGPIKNTRVFAFKIAEADIRHPGDTLLSECGLLLAPCPDEGYERGTFVRVGSFQIIVNGMHRDWLKRTALFKPKAELREGLWKDSKIEEKFYREKDDNDGYTIRIV